MVEVPDPALCALRPKAGHVHGVIGTATIGTVLAYTHARLFGGRMDHARTAFLEFILLSDTRSRRMTIFTCHGGFD